ncbi:hypothetical protein HZP67_09975 [Elizabethkingia anophelis]|nr:hypothetical protein [Elizabethkingia anophelis]MCT4148169.1 hypothetical protein [Elizabethkingia anophelis]
MAEGKDARGKFLEGNTFGLDGGRPPFYSTPELLAEKIQEYFTWIEGEFEIHYRTITTEKGEGKNASRKEERIPEKIWIREPENPTITGLAIFLGFESRQSLYDYSKKDGFAYSIKKALLHVENNYEKGLASDKVAGFVFALKNMGWTDNLKLGEDKDAPFSFGSFLSKSNQISNE